MHDYPCQLGKQCVIHSTWVKGVGLECVSLLSAQFLICPDNFNENDLIVGPIHHIIPIKDYCTLPLYGEHPGTLLITATPRDPFHYGSPSFPLLLNHPFFFPLSFLLRSFLYYL